MRIKSILTSLTKALTVAGLVSISVSGTSIAKDVVDPDILKAKEWRFVGPFRGGRVTTVTGVPGDDQTYYMGATGGGIWKTDNAGLSWHNITDDFFGVGTIGAIAVAPSDPNVLYAGTGEAPIRGVTTSDGDGMYRSTDAGRTWKRIGLETVGQISRIRVHPTNPDIAWVAAQGRIWVENEDRGIFKTTDGGQTWKHVLKVAPDTGGGELAIDPTNPRILYAAMWENGRKAWYIKSGGTDGGIFKSADGGETWEKLSGGLPEMIGKVGVDVAASSPNRVYAVVEAPEGEGGVYRSDDYGKTWTQRSGGDRTVQTRPWYYNRITVDPNDPNTIYVLNVSMMKSIDGGQNYTILRTHHGDYHDHWVNPENSMNMINANDGGAQITFDGGKSWSSILNQPTAQFYRLSVDNQVPYRLYAGQQDNSTVALASRTFTNGIGAEDFFAVGGGESAHIAFDPNNPRFIYATTINNTLTEYDTETKRTRPIKPYPEYVFGRSAKDIEHRANWNAPVAANGVDPSIIYYGTQRVMRTDDRGVTWTEISGDLTRNDKSKQGDNGGPITNESVGAEYYGTLFYIKPSPHEKGTIYAGSDDGLIHVTRDEGGSWTNVTPRGAPEGMINAIEVSPHDAATAYMTITAYKMGDERPYVYKTTNYGKSWKRIDKGFPQDTFVRVVREDPVRKGLLFAGTEKHMFVSFDDGKNWQSLKLNLPPVPITDLKIVQGDLVAATQGRGFWILDDISLLRGVKGDETKAAVKLFPAGRASLMVSYGGGGGVKAANPKAGVQFHYFLKEKAAGPIMLDIMDAAGNLVRSYSSETTDWERCVMGNQPPRLHNPIKNMPAKQGMNTWTWDMRKQGHHCIPNLALFAGFDGPKAMPGHYSARLTVGDTQQTVSFDLMADPRVEATAAQYAALDASMEEVTVVINDMMDSLGGLRKARAEIKSLMAEYADAADLQKAGQAAVDKITAWEGEIHQVKNRVLEDEDSWASLFDAQIRHVLDAMDNAGVPVTAGSLQRYQDLKAEWDGHAKSRDAIIGGEIKAVNDWAKGKGLTVIRPNL